VMKNKLRSQQEHCQMSNTILPPSFYTHAAKKAIAA
jgi:hypothetical protein